MFTPCEPLLFHAAWPDRSWSGQSAVSHRPPREPISSLFPSVASLFTSYPTTARGRCHAKNLKKPTKIAKIEEKKQSKKTKKRTLRKMINGKWNCISAWRLEPSVLVCRSFITLLTPQIPPGSCRKTSVSSSFASAMHRNARFPKQTDFLKWH